MGKFTRELKIPRQVVKSIFILCYLTLIGNMHAQRVERFPYEVSLREGKPNEIVVYNGDFSPVFSNQGVTLTNDNSQFSGFAIDHLQFNSTNGLTIEFEYLMYNGNTFEGKYGDGISVFLFDGSKQFSIGAKGAGLGYTYNRAYEKVYAKEGLDGAYLGIGIDQFGNFNRRMWKPGGEFDRATGIIDIVDPSASQITLRGAMHATGLVGKGRRGYRFSGYPVLKVQATSKKETSNTLAYGYELKSNGLYQKINTPIAGTFSLRPAGISRVKGDSNYRKAIITLTPGGNNNMIISVKIQHGMTIATVIDNYVYESTTTYYENANSDTTSSTVETQTEGAIEKVTYATSVPANFKIGFAASTGAASQVQIIRDLKVSLPYFPETKDILLEGCTDNRIFALQPYENAKFYVGAINSNPSKGNTQDFIDYSSFRFEDSTGYALTTAFEYEQVGVGIWRYNPNDGRVTFTPARGFVGLATIYYSAKGLGTGGGPYAQEIYRAGVTKMEIDIKKCPSKYARINPSQSSR